MSVPESTQYATEHGRCSPNDSSCAAAQRLQSADRDPAIEPDEPSDVLRDLGKHLDSSVVNQDDLSGLLLQTRDTEQTIGRAHSTGSSAAASKRPYTFLITGFTSADLPLMPKKSKRSTESEWSTKSTAGTDDPEQFEYIAERESIDDGSETGKRPEGGVKANT